MPSRSCFVCGAESVMGWTLNRGSLCPYLCPIATTVLVQQVSIANRRNHGSGNHDLCRISFAQTGSQTGMYPSRGHSALALLGTVGPYPVPRSDLIGVNEQYSYLCYQSIIQVTTCILRRLRYSTLEQATHQKILAQTISPPAAVILFFAPSRRIPSGDITLYQRTGKSGQDGLFLSAPFTPASRDTNYCAYVCSTETTASTLRLHYGFSGREKSREISPHGQ